MQQWTPPFRGTGRDWIIIGGFAALTKAVALFADKAINKFAMDIWKLRMREKFIYQSMSDRLTS